MALGGRRLRVCSRPVWREQPNDGCRRSAIAFDHTPGDARNDAGRNRRGRGCRCALVANGGARPDANHCPKSRAAKQPHEYRDAEPEPSRLRVHRQECDAEATGTASVALRHGDQPDGAAATVTAAELPEHVGDAVTVALLDSNVHRLRPKPGTVRLVGPGGLWPFPLTAERSAARAIPFLQSPRDLAVLSKTRRQTRRSDSSHQ
jgi:hypothetical protein